MGRGENKSQTGKTAKFTKCSFKNIRPTTCIMGDSSISRGKPSDYY